MSEAFGCRWSESDSALSNKEPYLPLRCCPYPNRLNDACAEPRVLFQESGRTLGQDRHKLTLRYPLCLPTPFKVQSSQAWDQAQDPNNTNLVVNTISSNGWLSLLLWGIVSYRTMFENIPKDFRVEPAYGSNVGTYKLELCTFIWSKRTHLLPEVVLFHSFGLPLALLWAWTLVTSKTRRNQSSCCFSHFIVRIELFVINYCEVLD